MKSRYPSIIKLAGLKIAHSPELYKEHYAKVLLVFFIVLIGIWGWLFYTYALRPAGSGLETTVPITTIPQNLLQETLKDINAREEAFNSPKFESVEDPFRVPLPPAPVEPAPEEVVE